jgi:hypothetical protein
MFSEYQFSERVMFSKSYQNIGLKKFCEHTPDQGDQMIWKKAPNFLEK